MSATNATAIVSVLAIHHLEHAEQRRLFAEVLGRLRPQGAFVNAEQVAGPSPGRTVDYDRVWDREAGFVDVDCVWWRFGVFAGWRRSASRTTHAADLQARPDAERRRSA